MATFALTSAGCVDREDDEGDSAIGKWWNKAKCDIEATADRVAEKTKEAFSKTKEVLGDGYDKAKELAGDGVDLAKEAGKKTSTYIKEQLGEGEHVSSEEMDDSKVKLAGGKAISTDIDVRGMSDDSVQLAQKPSMRRR